MVLYFLHVPVMQKMIRFGVVQMCLTSYLCFPSAIESIALNSTPSLLSVHKEYSFNEWDYSKLC